VDGSPARWSGASQGGRGSHGPWPAAIVGRGPERRIGSCTDRCTYFSSGGTSGRVLTPMRVPAPARRSGRGIRARTGCRSAERHGAPMDPGAPQLRIVFPVQARGRKDFPVRGGAGRIWDHAVRITRCASVTRGYVSQMPPSGLQGTPGVQGLRQTAPGAQCAFRAHWQPTEPTSRPAQGPPAGAQSTPGVQQRAIGVGVGAAQSGQHSTSWPNSQHSSTALVSQKTVCPESQVRGPSTRPRGRRRARRDRHWWSGGRRRCHGHGAARGPGHGRERGPGHGPERGRGHGHGRFGWGPARRRWLGSGPRRWRRRWPCRFPRRHWSCRAAGCPAHQSAAPPAGDAVSRVRPPRAPVGRSASPPWNAP
jgi:hypothetical protein